MEQKEVLEAYLSNLFKQQGETLDDSTLNALHQVVDLEERPPSEKESYRTLHGEVDTDGTVDFHSIKLFNLSQVSLQDLFSLLHKEMGILLFEDTKLKILYGLGALILDFYPHLKFEFNEQDSRVLLAVSELQKNPFTKEELANQYKATNGSALEDEKLTASINHLKDMKVLVAKEKEVVVYQLKEKIKEIDRKDQ